MELRAVIGDDQVDRLLAAQDELDVDDVVPTALDVLQLLLGWVSEEDAASWFTSTQRRLDDRTPVDALTDGETDEVLDTARAWAAARM